METADSPRLREPVGRMAEARPTRSGGVMAPTADMPKTRVGRALLDPALL